jgi:hypothetical protein
MHSKWKPARIWHTIALLAPLALLVACVAPGDGTATATVSGQGQAVETAQPTATAPEKPTPTETAVPPTAVVATPTAVATVPQNTPTQGSTAPASGPLVKISVPVSRTVMSLGEPLVIRGIGRALFEGHLMVEVLNNRGEVLAEEPTMVQAEDAGTGGEGPWSVRLPLDVKEGTWGLVYAFSTSAKDGSVVAADAVPVVLGAADTDMYVTITRPFPFSVLSRKEMRLRGTGAGLFEGNVVVQAQTEAGELLTETATTLRGNAVGMGGAGTWEVQLTVEVPQGTQGRVVAFSTSPRDGSIEAYFAIPVTFGE